MFFPHYKYESDTEEDLKEYANIAKNYIHKIACKKDFDELIAQVPLSPIEYEIINDRYKNFKSIKQIAFKLHFSCTGIYTHQRKGLVKIYSFLKYRKVI